MPLGTEVGLGPGDIVLDRDPAPPRKEAAAPTFWPMSTVAKRLPISAAAELLSYIVSAKHEFLRLVRFYRPLKWPG